MDPLQYTWDWNKGRNKKLYCTDEHKTTFRSLKLKVSDPGKLVALLSSLWDRRCPPIEMKINRYLMEVTSADLTFFLHVPLSEAELVINVVGENELQTPCYLSVGSDFSRRILKAKAPIYTEDLTFVDANLVALMRKILKRSDKERMKNIVLIPVNTSDCNRPSCFYGLVNSSTRIGGLDRNRLLVQECLRYCKALVLNTFVSDEEKVHSEMCMNVIENAKLAFTNIDSEIRLAQVLEKQTAQIMNASAAKVYFFKAFQEGSHASVLNYEPSSKKQADGVLEETILPTYISTPEIIINKQPSDAFHFTEILKKHPQKKIRTLMSFPTFFDGNANGHIEIMNKKVRGGFTKLDEEYARCLGAINGLAIEAMWKWREIKSGNTRVDSVDCVLMRRCEIHCGEVNEILFCNDLHSYDHLLEFRFDPYQVPDEHVMCILMGIFDELNLFRTMRIEEPTLLRFLISVKHAYGNLPFHNWYHGFTTAHFVFVLIYRLSLLNQGVITDIEAFALMLAALSHDIDFRGVTSIFQLNAGDNLAALYSSAGGIQQRMALSNVLRMITQPNCNLLSKLDLDEFKTFVNVFHFLMLDTNLAYYVDKMGDVYAMTFRKYDRSNTVDVRMFLSLCLTSAHLCDYSKPWKYFMAAHDRQMTEYYRTSDLNLLTGVVDFDEIVFNPKVQVELQINFLKCVVLPLFENLYIMFPLSYECFNRAETNKEILEDLMEALQKYPDTSLTDLYRVK